MDSKPTAWFMMQCWGCNKCETHPYTDHEDAQRTTEECKKRGWRRRTFGNCEAASPWFCSEDCAYNSYNAKRAEEYWANKKFQEQDAKIRLGLFFGFGAWVLLSLYCALFLGWCN